MKTLIACLAFLSISTFTLSAQDFQFEKSTEQVKKVKATIQQNGSVIIAIPEDDENKRYMLTNLPKEYQVNGLKVVFTGILGIIPPNYRLAGSPVKLTKIKACPGYEELGVTTKSFTFE